MEVSWKRGTQFRVDPQVAYQQIEGIRAKNDGSATAELLLHKAKTKANPLHDEFEWDNEAAAHQHRLSRARIMLRSFMVLRTDLKTDRPQRVYEVVREQEKTHGRIKHVYKTTDDIMKDVDLRAELLGRALKELVSLRNRYRDLQELAIVLRAIDELVETIAVS